MIEKTLAVPSCTRYALEFPFSSLKSGGKIRRVSLRHMKDKDGAFGCAEGTEVVLDLGSRTVDGLFCTSTQVVYQSNFFAQINFLGDNNYIPRIRDTKSLIEYREQDGTEKLFFLSESCIYLVINAASKTFRTFYNTGGDCAAVHCERVFIGKDDTLYYSEPMKGETWDAPTTYGSGYIHFPDSLGKIQGLASFRGKLYLFREHGITAITAFADPLNFKAAELSYDCGEILAGSVAVCGTKVCFFTEHGLHTFDGTVCKRASDAGDEEIDLSGTPLYSVCYEGRYFASVQLKNGERALYSYSVKNGYGRLLDFDCYFLAANGEGLYFSDGATNTKILALSEKFFPENGGCEFELEFAADDTDKGETYAESVTVSGAGEISLSLESGFGEKVSAKGVCGMPVRLPRALRGGEFTLKISPADSEFKIASVSFGMRRDDYDH